MGRSDALHHAAGAGDAERNDGQHDEDADGLSLAPILEQLMGKALCGRVAVGPSVFHGVAQDTTRIRRDSCVTAG
jgi:hypothetical protein